MHIVASCVASIVIQIIASCVARVVSEQAVSEGVQNRCLYSLRQAFQQMQSDLDPLRKGFSLQEEMDGGSTAPAAEEAAQPKPEAQLAAARKIQKEERQQMEIADRVILDVLRQVGTV